ncbi:MAG: isoleucine--tRNA ligase [Candidatus Moraniibacteriota bacterium]|nr:MAG: isoleucine--tRNA ligase [Candidatus Moranbacteria bacterium]
MAFKKVESNQKLPEMEKEIINVWNKNQTFQKTLENRKGAKEYTFYDGPPFATGLPHYGHIVASVLKDVVPRYWTMRGYYVERKWGWDCHGLPIENIVEKELGSKKKKDIEKMGVAVFNEKCREKVLVYVSEWEKTIERLGRWADMENAYRTMDRDYMESVWWVFKELWDRKLIYEDYRSMHICPRCETTLSQQEVSEEYQNIKDLSVMAKFALVDELNTYVLAWTTTPWTLPGNVALAVGNEITYVKVEKNEEGDFVQYICAKELVENIFKDQEYKIVEEFLGSEFVGKKYQPLFDVYKKDENVENRENGWKIYAADFVTTDEGTGVVHIAPAFGEDDMNLGRENHLPFVQHVAMDGSFKKELGDLAGKNVKPIDNHQETDVEIIKYLAKNGTLFHKEKYEHSYPHCWRCDTPLINYATTSWFVSVTKIKKRMLELAKEINWSPEHIKEGRFGKWLEGARDWSISRQRFWASVMPIWVCDTCDKKIVFGSAKELEDASGQQIDDLHKHIVDEVTFGCDACEGTMKRVPDVLDTWFDSGSMPYAGKHYPFENEEQFEQNFPADFIAEGVDQTRAWFYYQHVIATGIKDNHAFKNVVVNGIVLAEDGKKMSKKLQNYPDPGDMFEKYGADAVRFYLMQSPVVAAENMNFIEQELGEVSRGMLRRLWNSYSFFVLYALVDKWSPKTVNHQPSVTRSNILDRWILSELHVLIGNFNTHMEAYELHKAARLLPQFIDDLSNWYIRRSRRRFWKSEDDADKNEAYQTLYEVLVTISKVMAPFTPFITEEIFRNLTDEESVHLTDFPEANAKLIDEELNQKMANTRKAIEIGLSLRAQNSLKVRQPLAMLEITGADIDTELLELITDEVNVKAVNIVDKINSSFKSKADGTLTVGLDIALTDELKKEGQMRELIRHIQQARKKAGLAIDNRIKLCYTGNSEIINSFTTEIAKEVLATEIVQGEPDAEAFSESIAVGDEMLTIWIVK